MAYTIRRVDYFYTTIEHEPGEAYELLSQLAALGINMHAFTAVPLGPERLQLALFPEDPRKLMDSANKARVLLDGPHRAILVQGDDELGALAEIHSKLSRANVDVYASTAVADGRGTYGYLIYVRPDEYERAAEALSMGRDSLQETGRAKQP